MLRQYAAAAAKKAAAKRKAESESSNEKDEVNLQDEYIAGLAFGRRLRSRFLSPRIDDPGLLYADAFVCIGGALFVAQWALSPAVPPDIKIPPPSWLSPTVLPVGVNWRGLPYVLPALVHGSELACCWVLGALAASAYESEAYSGTLPQALSRTWRAGAFAVGVLILSTQLSLYDSLTAQGLDPYTVPSTEGIDAGAAADAQILSTAFELIIDIGVQAVQMTLFRAYRWREAQGPPGGGSGGGRRRQQRRPNYDADEYNPLKLVVKA